MTDTRLNVARRASACMLFLATITLVLSFPTGAQAKPARSHRVDSVSLVNVDPLAPKPAGESNGAQVVRVDRSGNALDAFSDFIAYFKGRYYLYGESYGCGFENDFFFQLPPQRFCGLHVYESRDLSHWIDRGTLFNPTGAYARKTCAGEINGCYGPVVIYNRHTRKYLLWFYTYPNLTQATDQDFRVMESSSPTGPFRPLPIPKGIPAGMQSFSIFVNHGGTAYLSATNWDFGIEVQKLNQSYTDAVGKTRVVTEPSTINLPDGGFTSEFCNENFANCGWVESPSIFRHGKRYYMTISDPICAYCLGGTGTSAFEATNPLGPWHGKNGSPSYDPAHLGVFDPYTVSAESCNGQPYHAVSLPSARGGTVLLQTFDLWTGATNNGSANHRWEPLSFERHGHIRPLRCGATTRVPLARKVPLGKPAPDWLNLCAVDKKSTLRQTFTVKRAGRLVDLRIPLYRKANPVSIEPASEGFVSKPLEIEVRIHGSRKVGILRKLPASTLRTSPTQTKLTLGLRVRTGDVLEVIITSKAPAGCYGTLYSVRDPYKAGHLHASGLGHDLVTPNSDLIFRIREDTSAGRTVLGS